METRSAQRQRLDREAGTARHQSREEPLASSGAEYGLVQPIRQSDSSRMESVVSVDESDGIGGVEEDRPSNRLSHRRRAGRGDTVRTWWPSRRGPRPTTSGPFLGSLAGGGCRSQGLYGNPDRSVSLQVHLLVKADRGAVVDACQSDTHRFIVARAPEGRGQPPPRLEAGTTSGGSTSSSQWMLLSCLLVG